MTEEQERLVSSALEASFRRLVEGAGPANKDKRTYDFVFHMTDWYHDLLRLSDLYQNPTKHDQKSWDSDVVQFLYHVVGHVLAAAKLSDTLIDPFGTLVNQKKRAKAKPARLTSLK